LLHSNIYPPVTFYLCMIIKIYLTVYHILDSANRFLNNK
jgi:hypothetical protein